MGIKLIFLTDITIFRFDIAKRIVSKAALTKSRMKLKYEALLPSATI